MAGAAWSLRIALKDYVFLGFSLFLKKQAVWRRAWSLEISRGRLATPNVHTPNVHFCPSPASRSAAIAVARPHSCYTSRLTDFAVTQNKGFSIYSEKRLKNWKHFLLLKLRFDNWVKKKVNMLKTLDNQTAACNVSYSPFGLGILSKRTDLC